MGRGPIAWILIGALSGYLARFLLRGPRPLGCLLTTALGIIGSIVGGTLANLLFDGQFDLGAAGIIGSVIGSMIVIGLLIPASRRRI